MKWNFRTPFSSLLQTESLLNNLTGATTSEPNRFEWPGGFNTCRVEVIIALLTVFYYGKIYEKLILTLGRPQTSWWIGPIAKWLSQHTKGVKGSSPGAETWNHCKIPLHGRLSVRCNLLQGRVVEPCHFDPAPGSHDAGSSSSSVVHHTSFCCRKSCAKFPFLLYWDMFFSQKGRSALLYSSSRYLT